MLKPVIFHPGARQDVKDAYQYYEVKQWGLGKDFVFSMKDAKQRIAAYHKSYRFIFDKVKKILLQRFPYVVFFKEHEREILIVAVFHCARNPAHMRGIIRARH
ncbi:MAG: type II toxin-antitoxin system RelE/ParE family toxin [Verrucomicrobiales bacterium]|jgi:plasmid stabilization system protein ParE|nr:type II toxin-antitoxin system RelE/ParE family toxin [Verrucomicrobiales bacterium]